jgi:tetratricopeptide (TPR) repeat protein
MYSILKGLGMTIWGLIAIGLMVIFLLVGYEVALKHRVVLPGLNDEKAVDNRGSPSLPSRAPGPAVSTSGAKPVPRVGAPRRSPAETRRLFQEAVSRNQYVASIEYGVELDDDGSAEPDDLSSIAKSYFAVSNCPNAQLMARKAAAALRSAGRAPDDGLRRIDACCSGARARVALGPAEKARIDQLLSGSDAAKAESGGPFVRLGELYYGFGEYELAIAAIQRGLEKGQIPHLEDAYVYLGRSERALGDFDAARDAFARLKDVPDISPKVLRLWTLYAQTRLRGSGGMPEECLAIGPGGS